MYGTLDTLTAALTEQTLIQLTDDEQLGTLDEAIALQCGATATARVDGYLRGLGVLPLPASFPDKDLLIGIERDLWVEELYARRPGALMPEALSQRATRAEAKLKAIQRREIVLDLGGSAGPTSGVGMITDKTPEDRVFPASVLDRW